MPGADPGGSAPVCVVLTPALAEPDVLGAAGEAMLVLVGERCPSSMSGGCWSMMARLGVKL